MEIDMIITYLRCADQGKYRHGKFFMGRPSQGHSEARATLELHSKKSQSSPELYLKTVPWGI